MSFATPSSAAVTRYVQLASAWFDSKGDALSASRAKALRYFHAEGHIIEPIALSAAALESGAPLPEAIERGYSAVFATFSPVERQKWADYEPVKLRPIVTGNGYQSEPRTYTTPHAPAASPPGPIEKFDAIVAGYQKALNLGRTGAIAQAVRRHPAEFEAYQAAVRRKYGIRN